MLLAAPADGGPESGEVVLAEVLALRTLFLNLQFRAASQGPMTEGKRPKFPSGAGRCV